MTFGKKKVLAAAIVVVFMAGLVKLWWLSRFLKKHTVLDLEKRTRQLEMQKSGLPVGKRVDIPFGVRAIQSGIQVDGIWISRPSSPVEIGRISPSFASSSTLEPESRSKGKGKEREVPVQLKTTVIDVEQTPEQSPQPSPAISLTDRYIPTGAEPSHVRAHPYKTRQTYRPRGPSGRQMETTLNDTMDADTSSHSEHDISGDQQVETYIPTNSFSFSSVESSVSSQQRTMVERSSTSSDEGARRSNMRYVSNLRRTTLPTPRTLNPLEDQDPSAPHVDYFSMYSEQMRNPFETPSSSEMPSVSRPPLAANRPIPHRSYSGDSFANTTSRKVNAGFEILPAGTFSRPSSQIDMEETHSRRNSNKIQKKNRDRSSKGQSMTR
ncbi:uncharacterized protein GGS25DRAFT_496842 [Hypoxylon fragiforme]|uniref:uncharacterized protein n=1 Tax=Hypoxylon fragiforme TaxID=63214 RepID=UPI0020C7008E|nr:uncharacterized protein GGS25DRAFT_496842 [Hypoxylon fragiforme]KAI2607628.1 hypothetical protein GGS25DRAFT_496842 [Hypoxylon fragiforme]